MLVITLTFPESFDENLLFCFSLTNEVFIFYSYLKNNFIVKKKKKKPFLSLS